MRILIIKPSSFGDIVHGLVVAERILSQLPGARIDWVARDLFAGLVRASGLVEKVYEFHRSPRGFLQIVKQLRSETYDTVLDFQGLARSGLMLLASRSKVKIGRFDGREGSRLFARIQTAPPSGTSPFHAIDILRQFQHSMGLENLSPGVLDFANSERPDFSVRKGSILLFPESRRPEKEWGGFGDLAKRLSSEFPEKEIVWLGTGTEPLQDSLHGISALIDGRQKVSLVSLPALVRESSVTVANDSGPIHLAAAMNRPVVGVFGPTDPRCYGPYPLDRNINRVVMAPDGNLATLECDRVFSEVKEVLLRQADSS
ncbi:MAG: glycosyltransferase family 9 protein [Verrucomicrobiota bacterium]